MLRNEFDSFDKKTILSLPSRDDPRRVEGRLDATKTKKAPIHGSSPLTREKQILPGRTDHLATEAGTVHALDDVSPTVDGGFSMRCPCRV